jgi:hypothetical protein
MDINHRDRRRRWLLRRIIGWSLLLLVVLWHFDGATGGELPWIWRVNNGSTYVRSVVVTKDVLIFNHKEQGASMRRAGQNLSNYPLICGSHCLSFLLGPICRQWSSVVLSASHDDIFYGVRQSGIISEDNISIIQNITTFTWAYRPRESIVLGMVTDSGVGPNSYEGNGWIAIYGPRSEPQTINNRADIGAELPMLGIERRISLIPSGIGEPISRFYGVFGINSSAAHLSQLAAHRIPLEQRGEERQYSYPGDYSSPNDQLTSDRRETPRFPYKRIFLGICVISLGGTCLWFSFESFEKISKSPRYMFGGVVLGLIAIALIGHGLFYACLGVWGLPSLYIL